MRLNLGCADRHLEGYVNTDLVEPADERVDLNQPWPWPDSSVEEIVALDILEHLPNKRHTMNEMWRVLKSGGIARIQVPHATDGDGGHCDPTHVSYWTTSDFEYYAPGVPERERFRNSPYYGIKADFRVLNLTPAGSIPMTRYPRRYGGYVMEIQVVLEAVK
jgi:hypothetical protein